MSALGDVFLRSLTRPLTVGGVAWLLTSCADSAKPLEWRVDFACNSDALATEQLTLRVLKGGCTGELVYESSIGRGQLPEPQDLDRGTYGFSATASGPGGMVAQLCEEHRLPSGEALSLVLRSSSCVADPDAAGPDAGSMDAGADAGPQDGGLADVTPPDAEPPCMPPKDCRPCAADGITTDCPPRSCMEFSFGSHTYLFCSDRQEWAAARTECRKTGRDLAIIETSDENAFIVSHLNGMTHWMGANDRGYNGINSCTRIFDEGAWFWIDPVGGSDKGEALCNATGNSSQCAPQQSPYTSWASGEPNNNGCSCIPFYMCEDGEDCGAIATGGWQDGPCRSELPYVCESY